MTADQTFVIVGTGFAGAKAAETPRESAVVHHADRLTLIARRPRESRY
jgi:hypothetical protein